MNINTQIIILQIDRLSLQRYWRCLVLDASAVSKKVCVLRRCAIGDLETDNGETTSREAAYVIPASAGIHKNLENTGFLLSQE